MDKDRIAGAAKWIKGSIKEVVGKITGDKRVQVEGTAEKAAAKVQSTAGRVKDSARKAVKE